MKLIRAHVIKADTCAGLLDGFDLVFRSIKDKKTSFEPFCLIGHNGAGKSQFIQVLAEMFQSVFYVVLNNEERVEGNPDLQFELEYIIDDDINSAASHVLITRKAEGMRKPTLTIQIHEDNEWRDCDLSSDDTRRLLPKKIIGYTSGGNETLSLPFLLSRGGYAADVSAGALHEESIDSYIPDTRLMLIDYGTHLEVLVANLLLGDNDQKSALLKHARLNDLHSFRCIVQLNHSAVPKAPKSVKAVSKRKGVQLTQELENYIDNLRRCSTCYDYDEKSETYIFDYLFDEQTKVAFGAFWDSTLELYSAFHKLAMLNDLAIPKKTRERFRKEIKDRRFAARLPEPQDEEKVFRFERVNFVSENNISIVDYVSLSDGEHQLAQLLGTFSMISYPNVLFLLDEPESHFNPQWRVKFISRLLELSTSNGLRGEASKAAQQECLLTTHAPFVPSDMSRENVLIFSKVKEQGSRSNPGRMFIKVHRPSIETFGTSFDEILNECFDVNPPISEVSRQDIQELMECEDTKKIKAGMARLGHSVEKMLLADRLRQLLNNEKA